MGDFIWSVALLAAVIVFVVALVQGKGFWNAVKMGIGVLILGFVAMVVLGLVAGLVKLTFGLLIIAFWLALIFGLVAVVAKVIRGTA